MPWGYEEAEAYLSSLEPIGWRFGLDRISRLVGALGMPQHRFASIHVVGTNGKSSVATMCAALLAEHGHAAGAYLSPHAMRWSERIEIGGREIDPGSFGTAVERVAAAVGPVNRSLAEGDSVTQFEAVTAAAFVALAAARVDYGVIEAGLGGRLDATNVLPSTATALTSVGLDHTQWLGETEEEIAAEKLAVLRERSALIVGRLSPPIEAIARRVATERHARMIVAAEPERAVSLHAPGDYLRRNLAVAEAAVAAAIGPLDPDQVRLAADRIELHGRMEVVHGDPPVILDAAHNPDGASALAEALPEVLGDRQAIACLAVLADKDARGVLRALAPCLEAAVCTAVPASLLERSGRPGTQSIGASELGEIARGEGVGEIDWRGDPQEAIALARGMARERGSALLITGSHYLLAYAVRAMSESGNIHA